MKKIAIFVEGYAELRFARRLIQEIAGARNIIFEHNAPPRSNIILLKEPDPVGNEEHFVLLYNCGSDSRVKSEILDQVHDLEENGYQAVLGLVDLYRHPLGSLEELETISHDGSCTTAIIVQIMEIEAWFVAEYHHFERRDANLTPAFINQQLGIQIEAIDFEALPHPAATLNRIHQLSGGKGYKKRQYQVENIVYSFDWDYFYFDLRNRSRSIDKLLSHLDEFLG